MGAPAITVYYNPRCSKCRQAAALLDERGLAFEKRQYLDRPPDRAELMRLLACLRTDDPRVLARTKEKQFAELGLDRGDAGAVLDALAEHPQLLERPIVVRGDRAVIARPPEKLLELL
jgi:arsenate reductase